MLAGRMPRSKDVDLHGDLVDMVKPGDLVRMTGTYCAKPNAELNAQTSFPVRKKCNAIINIAQIYRISIALNLSIDEHSFGPRITISTSHAILPTFSAFRPNVLVTSTELPLHFVDISLFLILQVMKTYFECNYIRQKAEIKMSAVTEEEKDEFLKMAEKPDIREKIIQSEGRRTSSWKWPKDPISGGRLFRVRGRTTSF